MKLKVGLIPVRCNPPQKAHTMGFKWGLTEMYDRIIIPIGSCYELGTSRFPILAFLREKMIRLSLIHAGIPLSKVTFVHLQDFNDNQKWWQHVTDIPGFEHVTHIQSGNEVIEEMIRSGKYPESEKLILVNPEKEMPLEYSFPFHSTDLRNAIAAGNYELFEEIAASGTIELLGHAGGFEGIRKALEDNGEKFIPGRQTVDMIITCKDKSGKLRVLTGRRKESKDNFPQYLALPGGGIKDYENPIKAAVRETMEETGIQVKIMNPNLEPSHVKVEGILSEMRFVGLFGSADPSLNGKDGGSSQVFHINLDARTDIFAHRLKATGDLKEVGFREINNVLSEGLAFQQSKMLEKAINMSN